MRKVLKTGAMALAAFTATCVFHHPGMAQSLPQPVQLAQNGEVGYFIDSRGRRVLYDLNTDRIIAIEEPNGRRSLFRGSRAARNAAPLNDPNYFPPAPQRAERQPEIITGTVPSPGPVQRTPLAENPYPGDNSNPTAETTPAPAVVDNPAPAPAPQVSEQPTEVAVIAPQNPVAIDPNTVAKLQVLLDRKGVSPGVIDGQMGSNVRKALEAYQARYREALASDNATAIDAMLAETGGPAFIDYTITPGDTAGPFIPSVPVDYAEKAKLDKMAYTSPAEALAERFHMDEKYLKRLNPSANFYQAGTVIRVANPGQRLTGKVAHIDADKGNEQVRAYDENGRLVAAYPATIGSTSTPSPSGLVNIERIALNPNYTYNPKINFTQGQNKEILTIPPGPNGPVGSVWIALSKKTYGIHGTPNPARIGKTNSHGCIRLTNWDAEELARMVKPGVTVEFLD